MADVTDQRIQAAPGVSAGRFWLAWGAVAAAVAAAQPIDHLLTWPVFMAGMGLRSAGALGRLIPFFEEMGTFFTPLSVAVGLALLAPRPWRDPGKWLPAARLLAIVIVAAGACELAKIGFGKQRMAEQVNVALATTAPARLEDKALRTHFRREGIPPAHYEPLAALRGGRGFASMPSSHTATASACFLVLARLAPPLAPLCWVLAVGCGLSRVWEADHYFTDVVAGALLALATVRLLDRPLARLAARWAGAPSPVPPA